MNHKRGFWVLIILLGGAILAACTPLYPTPKQLERGTSTRTPFLPRATFTHTPDVPPTAARASSLQSRLSANLFPTRKTTATVPPSPGTLSLTPSPAPSLTPSQPAASPTPSFTPSATFTVAPTNTAKAGKAVLEVSVTTNCRTGPGVVYPRVGSLYPDQQADLVARHAALDYWYIELPGSGSRCWLWGYYANPSGSYHNLPVYTPPPSPTSLATATPTASVSPSSTPRTTAPPLSHTPSSTPSSPPTSTPTPLPPTPTDSTPPPPSPTPGPTHTPSATSPPPTPTFTPLPTATPASKYCAYTSVLRDEEQQIKDMINDAREDHGLPRLQTNWELKKIARDHGRDMTCNGMYSHTSSDGTEAWQRISKALGHHKNWCYSHCCCSEIFYGGGSPETAFNWWMTHESQDPDYEDNIHKRTILSPYSTDLGVGVIYYRKGNTVRKFITVDFARP